MDCRRELRLSSEHYCKESHLVSGKSAVVGSFSNTPPAIVNVHGESSRSVLRKASLLNSEGSRRNRIFFCFSIDSTDCSDNTPSLIARECSFGQLWRIVASDLSVTDVYSIPRNSSLLALDRRPKALSSKSVESVASNISKWFVTNWEARILKSRACDSELSSSEIATICRMPIRSLRPRHVADKEVSSFCAKNSASFADCNPAPITPRKVRMQIEEIAMYEIVR